MRICHRIMAGVALLLLTPQADALELPAPELVAAVPAEQSQVQAPVKQIRLVFASAVDLVEVVLITPDQRRIVLHDASGGSEDRKGESFTLALPQPVTMEGTYLIDISASVTDPRDSSASALSTYSGFTIPAAPPAE